MIVNIRETWSCEIHSSYFLIYSYFWINISSMKMSFVYTLLLWNLSNLRSVMRPDKWIVFLHIVFPHIFDVMDLDSEQVFECELTPDTFVALVRVRRTATSHACVFTSNDVSVSDSEQFIKCLNFFYILFARDIQFA